MKRNVLIDAFNICMASAFECASRYKDFYENEEEKDTRVWGCVIGHITRLKKALPNVDTWYVCWDSKGGKDFRVERDSSYKANRTKYPVPYKTIMGCKDLFEQYGMINVSLDKAEADDIIYTLSQILTEKGDCRNIIVSRDRDMIQTVQAGYASGQWDPFSRSFVNIPTYDIIVYKSLVGDASDNIKGVKGIGPKKALAVIEGSFKLTQEQEEEYEKARDIVDFKRNPRFTENYQAISKMNFLYN